MMGTLVVDPAALASAIAFAPGVAAGGTGRPKAERTEPITLFPPGNVSGFVASPFVIGALSGALFKPQSFDSICGLIRRRHLAGLNHRHSADRTCQDVVVTKTRAAGCLGDARERPFALYAKDELR